MARWLLCLAFATAVAAKAELVMKNNNHKVSISLDSEGALDVPQHCRAETCGLQAQRLLTLEHSVSALGERQLASEKAIENLVAALSAHKNEAATDAELAQVKTSLQAAINNVALTPGPKGERGEQGAKGERGTEATAAPAYLHKQETSDRYCEYWSGGRTCSNPHHQPGHDIYKVK
eukprot:g5820.t1